MDEEQTKAKIVVVCGPTGVGKTATAIGVCEAVGGSIVGADSMQIYRYMDIGTAKPTPEEQARVRHDLIDVVDPDEGFDAARYQRLADQAVRRLAGAGMVPVVVGGTGLYIRTLLHGIFPDAPGDPAVRQALRQRLAQEGAPALHRELARCDPAAAERIHANDTLRILRALEVFATTGRPLSDYQRRHGFRERRYTALQIGLGIDRRELYQRIDRRVDQMIAAGLLDEVRCLLQKGYSPELKSMQSIGYRHMAAYLDGRLTWEESVRTLKRDTRRYAKRQLTWFKADPEIRWYRPDQRRSIIRAVKAFLGK
jgi:tRNA dimethylallyltransferase